ncbi:helix-turn-helix domain-containing protein [Pseudomonas sp.]|uniref:helix-turn-helix domain-containing protein n=1 Tax=Pseudomonas sp. TaxID=306 RepID=UPI0028AE065D|nr:helix-turn-helix domain-containing protein [Pseudomonas sp.]
MYTAQTVTPDRQDPSAIRLTPREQQVLLWCAYGKTSWEIGQILGCKESTVNFHVGNLLRKFDVETRVAAVIKAIRYDLLGDPEEMKDER